MILIEALGLEEARVVALCGAGGKTGLMFALARECAARGERVLITTTTKMALDETEGPWPAHCAPDAAGIAALAESGGAVMAYRAVDAAGGKVIGFPAEAVDAVARSGRFTRILVEADGSARRPLKAPAAHEPVFPAAADAVVMVAGAGGLGRPLDDETVFRAELWAERTGTALGRPVTAEALARMAGHPQGLARTAPAGARRTMFINQVDTAERLTLALRVVDCLRALGEEGPERVAVGRLRPGVAVVARAAFREDRTISRGK